MNVPQRYQKGQALILIALAIVAMVSFLALAIDGGNAFADRRQAQNAADAAALAAAMRYAQDTTLTNTYFNTLVVQRTTENGYNNTQPRSTVVLTIEEAPANQCPEFVDEPGLHFTVDIDSNSPTWFGRILGINTMHNHVTSKALSCPAVHEPAFKGTAVVALNKTVCQAIKISGTSNTQVTSSTNQGLYVASSCTDVPTNPQNALYGGSGSVSAPSVSVVGGAYGSSIFLPTVVQTGVARINSLYDWPGIDALCPASTPTMTVSGNSLTPGVFPGSNNSWTNKVFPPAGIQTLQPGVYCLDNDFKTTNSDTLNGTGVIIVQRRGEINIQGGAINLAAPNDANSVYRGLLFYMPESNTDTYGSLSKGITIAGSGSSQYDGSIVAPYAHVTINGSSATDGPFKTQVIADTITLGGGGTLTLVYDAEQQYKPPIPAGIQLIK
jgi:Flp pilus assembly protein TadG